MSPRGNPFEQLERQFERLARQFDEASRTWGGESPFRWWAPKLEPMSLDLVEHGDEFVVTVDLPGFERDDVDIKVTDRTLQIEAEHEEEATEEKEADEGHYLKQERHHESTYRSVQLPEAVDTEDVTATMKNGVLTVTLPRLDVKEARTIEVE